MILRPSQPQSPRQPEFDRTAEMNPSAKIHIAGHRGLVGSAIKRRLEALGYANILTPSHAGTRRRVDLFAGPKGQAGNGTMGKS